MSSQLQLEVVRLIEIYSVYIRYSKAYNIVHECTCVCISL